jgi:hypothetical protein
MDDLERVQALKPQGRIRRLVIKTTVRAVSPESFRRDYDDGGPVMAVDTNEMR